MRAALTVSLAAALLLPAVPARALHRFTPLLEDITQFNGGNSFRPISQSLSSRWMVFESTDDLLHNGSTGRQVFLRDQQPPRSTYQVTRFPLDCENPGVDADGFFVAFDTLYDIRNTGSTAKQIYIWSRSSNSFTQVTSGDKDSINPSVSNDGTYVVFQSDADLRLNGATGTNIYLYGPKSVCDQFGCGRLLQITNGGSNTNPVFSRDPSTSWVLFNSTAPLLGTSNGFQQIFLWTRATRQLRQLTFGAGDSTRYSIDDTGRIVLFQSTADLLGNGSTGSNIYVLDVQTGLITEIGAGSAPSLSRNATVLSFVSSADLLGNGSTGGPHLFVYDLRISALFQITKSLTGDSNNTQATDENLFFFDTTEDPLHEGITGRQIYALNIFRALPTVNLGEHTFDLQQGNGSAIGSSVAFTTRNGVIRAGIGGSLLLNMGAPDLDGEAPVTVPSSDVAIPPVYVPGYGTVCLVPAGNGSGLIDCNGGHLGRDLQLTQDHDTDISDPLCLLGCREGDPDCQPTIPGPHRTPCPVCDPDTSRCTGGLYVGLLCARDSDCKPNDECVDGLLGVCNGPVNVAKTAVFQPGAMTLTIPLRGALSLNNGPDNAPCTTDDLYAQRLEPAALRLTTGTANAWIADARDVSGDTLFQTDIGSPFDCAAIQAGTSGLARLVGDLTFLDSPLAPGLQDVIMSFRLQERSSIACNTGADCNDNNACNGVETCLDGFCAAGEPITCEDGNVCNGHEMCNPSDPGHCLPGTPLVCNDGNPCNGVESCDFVFGCQPGIPIVCDDGDPCNGEETCNPSNGQCQPGTGIPCDDFNPCTVDSCDASGCHHVPLGNGTACDDGNLCTTGDTCLNGACVGGATVQCNDGNLCNGTETCNPATGTCQPGTAMTCDDGNPCNGVETCNPTTGCVPGTPMVCSDGNACNGLETCNPLTGTCQAGTPLQCDDGNPCNGVETCNPATGCVAGTPIVCSDGDACNGLETCNPLTGTCQPGTPLVCDDHNACNGVETCNPATGCVPGIPLVCDDGNPCNGVETCNPATGCVPGTPPICDDGNACNGVETCDPQIGCVGGTPIVCDDGDKCNGEETCNPITGACLPGIPLNCTDSSPCTTDSCNPAVGCVNTALADGTLCDDGSLCTTGDTCLAGACVGVPTLCPDDGNVCNGVAACDPLTGACVASLPLNCDDGIACTTDTCDPVLGCQHQAPAGIQGVLCVLEAMETQLKHAQRDDIRGRRLPRRLVTLIVATRQKVQTAASASNERAVQLMNRANNRIQRFIKLVTHAQRLDRVKTALATSLLDESHDVLSGLTALIQSTPTP